jgi:hypothetical protein
VIYGNYGRDLEDVDSEVTQNSLCLGVTDHIIVSN